MKPTQPPAGGFDPYAAFPGCYRHPDRLTGVRCVRCDRPICPECQHPAAVGFQCPDDVKAGAASIRRPRTIAGATISSATTFVSFGLISLNVLAYVATGLSPGGTLADNRGSRLFDQWLLRPSAVAQQHEYYRLIISAFLHIGPLHLIMNMIALYVIGPPVERALGWWRFAAVYLLAALGGSVATMLLGDEGGSVAGASGAIFGLFAAALVLSRASGFDTRSLIIVVVLNFVLTFSIPGISKLGHIGGFVLGGVATFALLGWRLNPKPASSKTQMQVMSLAALLVVMIVTTVWRVQSIGGSSSSLGGAALIATIQPAPDRGTVSPQSSTTVDGPGENYSEVITAV